MFTAYGRELSAGSTTIDGKRLYTIRQTENGEFDELLFDPATGRAVGRASGVGDVFDAQATWVQEFRRS